MYPPHDFLLRYNSLSQVRRPRNPILKTIKHKSYLKGTITEDLLLK